MAYFARFESAVAQQDVGEALWLVDSGLVAVDAECGPNRETLFTCCCACGHLEGIKALLRLGADVCHRTRSGRNGLMKAAANGHLFVLCFLLEKSSAKIDLFERDCKGKTALDWARLARRKECASFLEKQMQRDLRAQKETLDEERLSEKLDELVFSKNRILTEEMRELVQSNDLEGMKRLLASEKDFSKSLFKEAVEEKLRMRNSEIVVAFADVAAEGGLTPLMRASGAGEVDLIRSLIRFGAQVNLVSTRNSHSALTWASACLQAGSVRELLLHGADLTQQTTPDERTPLMHGICKGSEEVVEVILEKLFEKSMEMQSALLVEKNIRETDIDKVELFEDWSDFVLSHLEIKDASGRTARDFLMLEGNENVKMLIEAALNKALERKSRRDAELKLKAKVGCPLGCGLKVAQERLDKHQNWDCRERELRCPRGCGEKLKFKNIEAHLRSHCGFRILWCRNTFQGCRERSKAVDISLHEVHKCLFRKRPCRLGCGSVIQQRFLFAHENDQCKLRVVQCSCGEYLKAIEMKVHRQSTCKMRFVLCRVGCGETFPFELLEAHENEVCRQLCSHGCGLRIGPSDKRAMHEKFLCFERIISCRLECNFKALHAKNQAKHEKDECPNRSIECPLHCGQILKASELSCHMNGESGGCPFRLLPCLFDYVGNRVSFKNSEVKGIVLSFDVDSGKHEVWCSSDNEIISGIFGASGLLMDVAALDSNNTANWSCGFLRACDRMKHLQTTCCKRKLSCPNDCGQVLRAEDLQKHLAQGCVRRLVKCSHPGCKEEFLSKQKWHHEQVECNFQTVECACGQKVDKLEMPAHIRTSCMAAKIRCVLGCGQYVPRSETPLHVEFVCEKRLVNCPFGCGEERIWATRLIEHEQECLLRAVDCQVCERPKVCAARDLPQHHREFCERRLVNCECGQEIRWEDMSEHRKSFCAMRLRFCPLGCGIDVADKDMEQHQDSTCRRRYVECKECCARLIRWEEMEKHLSSECRRRKVSCTNDCGDHFRAEQLGDHILVCPNRQLRCDTGSESCTRALKDWIVGDVGRGRGRLAKCDIHHETALTLGALHGDFALVKYVLTFVLSPEHDPKSPKTEAERRKKHAESIIAMENKIGHNALSLASREGHLDLLRYLWNEGGDLGAETSRGRTPLSEAILRGHESVVRYLVHEVGVPIDRKSKSGMVPLTLAQRLGYGKIACVLAEELACQNLFRKITILVVFAKHDEIAKLLREGSRYFLNQGCELESALNAKEKILESAESKMEIISREIRKIEQEHRAMSKKNADTEFKRKDYEAQLKTMKQRRIDLLNLDDDALRREVASRFEKVDKRPQNTRLAAIFDFVLEGNGIACCFNRNWSEVELERLRIDFTYLEQFKGGKGTGSLLYLVVQLVLRETGEVDKLESEIERTKTTISMIRPELDFKRTNINDEKLYALRCALQENKTEFIRAKDALAALQLRVFCWRTLNMSDPTTGHSLLSWAAVYGSSEIVELLLESGAPADVTDTRRKLSAVLIQTCFRGYLARISRPRWRKSLAASFWKEDLVFRLQLSRSAKNLKRRRLVERIPLQHAVFNGNTECAKLLMRFGAKMFRESCVVPTSPAPFQFPSPFLAVNDVLAKDKFIFVIERDQNFKDDMHFLPPEKRPMLSVLKCAEAGVQFRGCQAFRHQVGWDAVGRHEECLTFIRSAWANHLEKRDASILHRKQLRSRSREMKRIEQLHRAMTEAISEEDFQRVLVLVDEGALIDFETSSGHTALSYASWRGSKFVNEEGATLLAVDVLLGRDKHKPNVNRETRLMHTPLSLASRAGRLHCMEVLIREGADPQKILRNGKTALIQAAEAGKTEACRLLIEHGADVNQKDFEGNSAIDFARKSNFVKVMALLASLRFGHLGTARAQLGVANPVVQCCWGCGAKLNAFHKWALQRGKSSAEIENEADENFAEYHEKNTCPKRFVDCSLGCGIQMLWACEVASHEMNGCPFRRVGCPRGCEQSGTIKMCSLQDHLRMECLRREMACSRCGENVTVLEMQHHMEETCEMRAQLCSNDGCGKLLPWNQYASHRQQHCQYRNVRCRIEGCEQSMMAHAREVHEQLYCSFRRIPCKWNCDEGTCICDKGIHELEQCPRRLVECPRRCSMRIEARDLERHRKEECPGRFVSCEDGCPLQVPVRDMERHLKEECELRTVCCSNAGCGKRMRAKFLRSHEDEECMERVVFCGRGCGENIPMSQLLLHKEEHCQKRTVVCRNDGCTKLVSLDEQNFHEKSECRKRIVWCEFGCRAMMIATKVKSHMLRDCPKRVVQCRWGCIEMVRAENQEIHELKCIRKIKE